MLSSFERRLLLSAAENCDLFLRPPGESYQPEAPARGGRCLGGRPSLALRVGVRNIPAGVIWRRGRVIRSEPSSHVYSVRFIIIAVDSNRSLGVSGERPAAR